MEALSERVSVLERSHSGAAAFPRPAQPGGTKVAEPPSNPTDMNKDIEIDAKAGNFVIFVMAYSGPKAPEMARIGRAHQKRALPA